MALQPPLRPARSVRKPNSTEPLIQEKSSLEIVRSGSIKSRPVKKRDSIDLAKQSHAFRNAPLPPLPPMQRSETSPVRRQDVDAPPVPSKIPGDGRPIVLPSSPHPARKLSLRRKQKTAPDILVPGQRPQWDISSSPRRNEVNGRQSLGGGEATPPGSGLMISHTSSLSDELGQGECPQEKNMKMGRWNLLGGLFAKKASTSAPTSPPSRTPRDSSSSGEKSMTEGKGGRFRSRSKSRGARNRDEFDKPTFNRAKTAPFRVEHISKPLPPLGTEVQLRSGSVPRSRAMLDVEIPNVELERYSVMFGDVLGDSNSLEKDQTPMDVPRGRQQSTPTSHPRNVERGMGLAKSRGHRGNSRNLSIDLGLSIFPPSPSLKPSPLKPRNHRRSRTLADLKLSDSPSITGFIVQAPPVKPSPPRSRAIGGISRYGDKMSPLPPPPPPPIPKSAKDLIPLIRVASSRPMESGAAIQQTRTVVMKQQSSVNPTWEIPPHSNEPSKQAPQIMVTRQISFSRRNLRPEPLLRATTTPNTPSNSSSSSRSDLPPLPTPSTLLPSTLPNTPSNCASRSDLPPLPTPSSVILPSSAPPWNTYTNGIPSAISTPSSTLFPSSAPPWNTTTTSSGIPSALSTPIPTFILPSSAPPWMTTITNNNGSSSRSTPSSSLSDLIQATSSPSNILGLDHQRQVGAGAGVVVKVGSDNDPSERFVDRKALGHLPILVTHSPSSPSARKSQQVLLECA